MTVGETAMRPGEIFALHRPDVHMDKKLIHVRWQLDLITGHITWPKDDDGRWVPMSPALHAHFEQMPRMGKIIDSKLGEIVFPSVRGGYMRRSQWSSLWNAIRVAAGMPGQDFYELKHRAIQWMVDPVEDGGLGLDPATAAEIVGHDDGGYLIATVYTKLGQRRALARAQRAMTAYQQRRDGEPPRLASIRHQGELPVVSGGVAGSGGSGRWRWGMRWACSARLGRYGRVFGRRRAWGVRLGAGAWR
jgi:integrase